MDLFKRLFTTIYGKIFLTTYIVAIISMAVYSFIKRYDSNSISELKMDFKEYEMNNELMKSRMIIDSLTLQLKNQLRTTGNILNSITGSSTVMTNYNINNQHLMDSLFDKVNNIEEVTNSLRQAINPLNPDEVLTIARLNDEISRLIDDQKSYEKRLDDKIQNLSITVLDKADSSDKTTYLAIFILAPILLNFMYTVWKDNKADKKAKSEK